MCAKRGINRVPEAHIPHHHITTSPHSIPSQKYHIQTKLRTQQRAIQNLLGHVSFRVDLAHCEEEMPIAHQLCN